MRTSTHSGWYAVMSATPLLGSPTASRKPRLLHPIQEAQYSLRERFWLFHVWQMRAMGEEALLRAWDRVGHDVRCVYSGGVIERPGHHQRWNGDRIQTVNG